MQYVLIFVTESLAIHFRWLESELFRPLLGPTGLNWFSLTSDFQWCCLTSQGSPVATQHVVSVESSSLILHGTFRDLFVLP